MAKLSEEQVRAGLQARYDFRAKKLATAATEEEAETAQIALDAILTEAASKGVELVTSTTAPSKAPATVASAKTAKQPKSVAEKEKVADRAARLAAEKKEGKVKGATVAKKVKKAPVLKPCLDGCGELVGGNFKMGHDAKLKSLLLKVERGEVDMSELPEIVQGIVKFKKGEVETEHDAKGKVVSKTQTYVLLAAPVKFPGRELQLTEREAA